MAYLESNSTHKTLGANESFTGQSVKLDPKYITIQVSFKSDGASGTLKIFHSFDGIHYDDYGDVFHYSGGNHHKQVGLKGSFVFVKYINDETPQSSFELHSKLSVTIREELEVSLNSTADSISVPKLEEVIGNTGASGPYLNVMVGGFTEVINYGKGDTGLIMPFKMTDDGKVKCDIGDIQITANGLVVDSDINGQYVYNWSCDGSGNKINSTSVNGVKGLDTYLINSNIGVTGQVSVSNMISGFATNSTLTDTNYKLDTLQTTLQAKNLNYTTDSVSVGFISEGVSVDSKIFGEYNGNMIPLKCDINGLLKTEVSNFPATQAVSGSVSVSNLPATQAVSGTFWPATQPVSGSVNVSNTTPISVSGSMSVSNFPATQAVSGSVSVSNLPSMYGVTGHVNVDNVVGISGTVSVSNLPSIYGVTGHVNIDNVVGVTGTVSVSNMISGFSTSALQTTANNLLTDIKTKTLDSNSDSVMVWAGNDDFKIRNLSSSVDNVDVGLSTYSYLNRDPPFPASRDVLSTQLVGVDDLTGSNLINLISNVDGHLKVEVNNVVGVTGTVSVSNLPSIYGVTGHVNVDNVVGVTGTVSVSNLPSIYGVTGNINITNSSIDTHLFASTNGSTWHHLKSDANGVLNTHSMLQDGLGNNLTSKLISSSQALDVNIVNNTDPIIIDFANPTLNVEGNVSINNYPSVQSVSGDINVNNFPSTQNVNITNSSAIPVSGSFYPATQPVSGTITANIASNQTVLSNVYDWQHNGITSTNHTAFKYGLDTTSALATTDMTTRYLLTSTSDGGSKRGLDVNVASGSITVSSVNIKDSSGNNLTSTSNNLDVNVKAYSRTDASTTTLTSVQPVGASSSVKALETYSYMVGLNNSSNLPLQITTTTGTTTQSMDCFINNETTATSGGAITGYTATGLNTYQILPKMKSFSVSALNNYAVAGALMAGQGSQILVNTYAWGKANSTKTFYLYTPAGTPSVSPVKTISYTYINSAGNEMTATATSLLNGGYVTLQSNIVGVNNFSMTGNYQFISTDSYHITLANTGGTANSVCSFAGTHYSMQNGIFTVPNNAIAMVTSVDGILATANEFYYMDIWDANGNRDVAWTGYMYASGVNNIRTAGGGSYGCIGRILKAGETVAFHTVGTTSTNKNILANIKVVYF